MTKQKKVLYVVKDAKSAQFRYQVGNVMEAVEGTKYKVEWIGTAEIEKKKKKIDEADLVVILRQGARGKALLKMIDEVQKRGTKVLFVLDDLVFDYRDLPVLMKTTRSRNFVYWVGYFWGIRRVARRVDGFITTNEFLGKKLERTFRKPYAVIRNSLNKVQVEMSKEIVERKEIDGGGRRIKKGKEDWVERDSRRQFRIGYFSGSPTHEGDVLVAEEGLLAFLEKHEDAILEVVGYMNFHGRMKRTLEAGRIKILPFVDYEKLEKMMAEVDVNVAPLPVNDFTNSKSELKFFEAGVVETTTIASPTFVFRSAISDGKNGFLAQPNEWYEKLEYLYLHPEENRKIAKRARKDALKNYFGKKISLEVEQAYDEFLG